MSGITKSEIADSLTTMSSSDLSIHGSAPLPPDPVTPASNLQALPDAVTVGLAAAQVASSSLAAQQFQAPPNPAYDPIPVIDFQV
jgi:hypothetical protein